MLNAHIKINVISFNFDINIPKSVGMCGYELPINVQNFTQKVLDQAKISLKVVAATFLDSPCKPHSGKLSFPVVNNGGVRCTCTEQ